jgi:SAM-dependent methyltransferase
VDAAKASLEAAAATLRRLFVCPRCHEALVDAALAHGLGCGTCGSLFPPVGPIFCLLADPQAARQRWCEAAARLRDAARHNIAAARAELDASLAARTRQRIEHLIAGLVANNEAVLELLSSAGLDPDDSPATAEAQRPLKPELLDGYVAALRDWAWQDGDFCENRESAELVASLVADAPLGKVLVLGAGGCRLAFDIHERLHPEVTVALDINPVPMLIAARALSGTPLSLWEFPPVPRDGAHGAMRHDIGARRPRHPGLLQVFADGLSPPIKSAAFDTVVTPWFIDQAPDDLAELLGEIHRVLAPGGRWINLGPLIYRANLPLARRYPLDEVVELARDRGLMVDAPLERNMQYLWSPASSQGRVERVVAFVAARDDAPASAPVPPWQRRVDVPIPRFAGLDGYHAPNPLFDHVAKRIDGRASAADIADELVQRYGVPRAGAADGVRLTVVTIARACQR